MNEICKLKLPNRRPQPRLEQSEGKANLPRRKEPAEKTESLAGVRQIKLTQGKFALVDTQDYEELSKHKWFAYFSGWSFYAGRCINIENGKQRMLPMHRQILNLKDSRIYADHKNGDGLDNRRENLRAVTPGENQAARLKKRSGCTSKYRGVWLHPPTKKWVAAINLNRKKIHIGVYSSECDAAMAYNTMAVKLGFKPEALNTIT